MGLDGDESFSFSERTGIRTGETILDTVVGVIELGAGLGTVMVALAARRWATLDVSWWQALP